MAVAGDCFCNRQMGHFWKERLTFLRKQKRQGVLFFDADLDGDPDLYVVSGGTEHQPYSPNYQDRFYLNDGLGRFTYQEDALPVIQSSGSCVVASDYDKDGDLDLFVGGRILPGHYPMPPRSLLLRNEGGSFEDVTSPLIEGGSEIGLVSAALWTDYDQDGWTDLMLAGEWMPITLLKNMQGKSFVNQAIPGIAQSHGWWNSLHALDMDQDGDMDYVAATWVPIIRTTFPLRLPCIFSPKTMTKMRPSIRLWPTTSRVSWKSATPEMP